MSEFSDYLETSLINHIFRGTTFTSPSSIYIALFTSNPTDLLGSTTGEVLASGTWTDYERKDAAVGGTIQSGWAAPGASDGTTSNAKVITFDANNGSAQVTVTHIGIFDAATAGNLLFHSPLASDKVLLQGDVLSFGVGSITVTLD